MYNATTFGFSDLQGPHQDAQKSTIVTFPAIDFKEIIFPSVFGAEKSFSHCAAGAGPATGATGACGFPKLSIASFAAFPGFVSFNF